MKNNGELIEPGTIDEVKVKYQTAMLDIEFEGNHDFHLKKIKELPSVSDCFIESNKLNITATSLPEARSEILKIAIKEEWPITTLQITRVSLEDLFKRLVKK